MGAKQAGQSGADERVDVKSEVARTLIAAMREGDTPWQRPWAAEAMRPENATTQNAYRGINLVLLGLAGGSIARETGHVDPRWCTYRQAEERGWQVRKGEKGTMIVKVVEFDREQPASASTGAAVGDGREAGGRDGAEGQRRFALRRYFVFNAQQIDRVPPMERAAAEPFEPVAKAEAIIEALKTQTGLRVIHGGDKACYVPDLDEVRLPPKCSFRGVDPSRPGSAAHAYFSVALHECSHSTLHEKRLDRREAIAKRWGDSAYALEELTVEIAAACLAAETGVPMSTDDAHIAHHASYLNSWIKVVEHDPMAIFTAAKGADTIACYLSGLGRQQVAISPHAAWISDYEAFEARSR